MSLPAAVVIGALMVACAILFVFRWEVAGPAPLVLDRWTGVVVLCDVPDQRPVTLRCRP